MKTLTHEEYEAKAARRFWSKVDKTGSCWIWTGHKCERDYGFFSLTYPGAGRDITIRAHRYAWSLVNGPIPDGIEIDHGCHTTLCVNPSHLRAATRKQNSENRQGATRNSASGVRGVHWDKEKKMWRARVGHNSRQIHVGLFHKLEDADAAVRAKQAELYTHHPMSNR